MCHTKNFSFIPTLKCGERTVQAGVPACCLHCSYCDCSALSEFTYSCKESGCLPAASFHGLWISLPALVCVCVCACRPQPPRLWVHTPISYAYQQASRAQSYKHTPPSEIMSVPRSADLFLFQQLQKLLNMWALKILTSWQRKISRSFSFWELFLLKCFQMSCFTQNMHGLLS